MAGPVTVNANAILQGGNGATGTTLTLGGALTLNPGSIIQLALGAGGTHSTLDQNGTTAWSFNSSQAFSIINLGAEPGVHYDIITDLAASPGITSSWFITDPGFAGMFMVDGNTIDLNLTAVPEPLRG